MQYYYPGNFYPYQDYYLGYYEPRGMRPSRNLAYGLRKPDGVRSDIDESVKKLIQLSKEQIAKEKQAPYSQLSHSDDKKGMKTVCHASVNCETNRLSKHVVDILENVYQTSAFVNRKKREEIAEDLHLSIEKVRNWFQNRRGKDRRQTQIRPFKSKRPEIHAHKPNEEINRCKEVINQNSSAGFEVANVTIDDPVGDLEECEPPEEDASVDLESPERLLQVYGTMPYWPASHWSNDYGVVPLSYKSLDDSVISSRDQVRYRVAYDAESTKSYTVLKKSIQS